MRAALGISKGIDILEHIRSLPQDSQSRAHDAIQAVELEAMASMRPQPGLSTLMEFLATRHIRKAICTRNFDLPVQHLMNKFLPDTEISPVVTRTFNPPKPDPASIISIARAWGVLPDEMDSLIMVGDSIDDMLAGRRAGVYTVLLASEFNSHLATHTSTDCVIHR